MAKLTLTDISSGYLSTTVVNANNALIETALENTLSRDGTTPNTMGADLDMNSNRIVNLAQPVNSNDAARLADLEAVVAAGLPDQTGHAGAYLTTDGTAASWSTAPSSYTASEIANVPAGSIAATDVQAAIDELASEKQPLDATLTALAGVATAADKLIYATGSDTFSTTDLTAAGRAVLDDADAAAQRVTLGVSEAALEFIINGSGSVITTGVKGDIEVPCNCTVNGWTILADQSGSIVVDVWKDTYANYPPTVADTIAGTEKPTLSSATKNQDLTLTTWTTSLTKGDILRFNVDSVSTVTRVTVSLRVTV